MDRDTGLMLQYMDDIAIYSAMSDSKAFLEGIEKVCQQTNISSRKLLWYFWQKPIITLIFTFSV